MGLPALEPLQGLPSPHEGPTQRRLPLRNQFLMKDPAHPRGPVPQVPFSPPHGGSRLQRSEGIEDLLQDLPDRKDLQRLYDRKVPLDQIVRLLGHRVEPDHIGKILDCDDPEREIRRLLG